VSSAPGVPAEPPGPGALSDAAWSGLSPRALPLWRLTALLLAGAAALVATVPAVAVLGIRGLLAGAVVALGVGGVGWRTAATRHAAWGYAERAADLLVRRGVLVHRLSVVPYGRMQFVDVTSGPLERRFGLATVVLHTAAAATDARVPGLEAGEAARLRDRLAALGVARAAGL
jgi:membrane protein YdbS with pleckstrin-like domain